MSSVAKCRLSNTVIETLMFVYYEVTRHLTCVITLTAIIGNNFSLLLEFFYYVYLTVVYYRLWEGDVGIHVTSVIG